METHCLQEIEPGAGLVGLFHSQLDEFVFIVESGGVRTCHRKDMEVSLLNRQLGYNVAGYLYLDVLLHQEFLFLLKNNGDLVILDSHLQTVDLWRTRIGQDCLQKETFFCIDANNMRFYVNIFEDRIHGIDLVHENGQLKFNGVENVDKLCVYRFSSTIINMDFAVHYNAYSMEEFHTIAVLLKDSYREFIYFRAIYLIDPISTKDFCSNWAVLLENIDICMTASQYQKQSCHISTISNMGFFIFTSKGLKFLTLPNGPQNYIDNNVILDIFQGDDLFAEFEESYEDSYEMQEKDIQYCPLTMYTEHKDDLIKFHILTTSGKYSILQFKKTFEEEIKYVMYWEQSYTHINFSQKLNLELDSRYQMDQSHCVINTISTISNNLLNFSILLNSDIFLMGSLKSLKANNWKKFNYTVAANYTNVMTSSFDCELYDLVYCGNHSTNVSYVRYLRTPFHNHYKLEASEDDISINDDIIVSTPILNTSKEICYVSKDGSIKWSDSSSILKISKFNSNDSYLICSIKNKQTNYTYLVQNNTVSVIENYDRVIKSFKFGHENISINDITLHCVTTNSYHIWLTDIYGKVFCIDKDTGSIIKQLKLHYKELKFINFIDSLLLYHGNIIIKIQYDMKEGKYKFLSLFGGPDIVKYFQSFEIIIDRQNQKFRIIEIRTDENIESLTKIFYFRHDAQICSLLRLSPVSPFIILNSFYNYESKLLVFDLNKECVVDEKQVGKGLVTDMISIKYLIPDEYGQNNSMKRKDGSHDMKVKNSNKGLNEFQLAEKIIMDQCFIISLNYEMSEFEDEDNLIIFMLDDEMESKKNLDLGNNDNESGNKVNGQLIEMKKVNTEFNITKMCNYEMNNIIVVGDKIAIYNITYSMKWDTFVVKEQESNYKHINIESCYVKQIVIQTEDQYDKLLLFDILSGVYQYKIFRQREANGKYHIERVINSQKLAVLQDIHNVGMITNFQYKRTVEGQWFIMSIDLNKLRIYHLDQDDEINMFEILLPNVILNIDDCPNNNYLCQYNNSEPDILFYVTTTCNGLYSISFGKFLIHSSERKKLISQMEYICDIEEEEDEEEEKFSIDLIDSRILKINV